LGPEFSRGEIMNDAAPPPPVAFVLPPAAPGEAVIVDAVAVSADAGAVAGLVLAVDGIVVSSPSGPVATGVAVAVEGVPVAGVAAAGGVAVAGSGVDFYECRGMLTLEVLYARDLVAMDTGLMRSNKSDPYVVVSVDGVVVGTTKVVPRNLNPQWNETFVVRLDPKTSKSVKLAIFDKDRLTADDAMGQVEFSVQELYRKDVSSTGTRQLLRKTIDRGKCDKKKAVTFGTLELAARFVPVSEVRLAKGTVFNLDPIASARVQTVGLGWTPRKGDRVDLDASAIFFGADGAVADALYFGKRAVFEGAATHSGDARSGLEAADASAADECISLDLARLPRNVAAVVFVVNAYAGNFQSVKDAFVGLYDPVDGEVCRYSVDVDGAQTGLVMCRLARSQDADLPHAWVLSAIGDVADGPRDWGSWVPELKHYVRDVCPSVKVGDAKDRVAVLRKGGCVDLAYYSADPITTVAMGLAWDITRGVGIDLDAAAILLAADGRLVEIVNFKHLKSNDGSIQHSGDDRSGDGDGDDETITVRLDTLSKGVAHVAFVVCSYDGKDFTNVQNTSCHLFVPQPKNELATFSLSSKTYACTALLMAVLTRAPQGWTMTATGEGCSGRVAADCVDEAQEFLLTGSIQPR